MYFSDYMYFDADMDKDVFTINKLVTYRRILMKQYAYFKKWYFHLWKISKVIFH